MNNLLSGAVIREVAGEAPQVKRGSQRSRKPCETKKQNQNKAGIMPSPAPLTLAILIGAIYPLAALRCW